MVSVTRPKSSHMISTGVHLDEKPMIWVKLESLLNFNPFQFLTFEFNPVFLF